MNRIEKTVEAPRYINRESSWLAFNQRVLQEATKKDTPLLERLKFLAITASNLDEFFKVRVGGLRILRRVSPDKRDISGLTADEQLFLIEQLVRKLTEEQYDCLLDEIIPQLRTHQFVNESIAELSSQQADFLQLKFDEEFKAVISPIMIDATANFPLFASAALCICVRIQADSDHSLLKDSINDSNTNKTEPTSDDRFAVLPVPRVLDRFIGVPASIGYHFVLIESVLEHFVDSFFPNQNVLECVPFRVIRNADMSFDEDGASDLLLGMTEMLVDRKSSECIRLELAANASDQTKGFLMKALNITEREIYACRGPLDLAKFMSLTSLPGFDELRTVEWPPLQSPEFPVHVDIFETIAGEDRVLVHPYESYDPVLDLIQTAANDPAVIAIKQILYRTSRDSAIVKALGEAAANGKSVTVIVELKARFDEERNIKWARQLEEAGVDVIYGVRGLKTHAKLCLIVRREPQGIQRYMHFATGNYNESTARLYGDVSLFTCDQQLGDEATSIFNAITGLSVPQPTARLGFSPIDLRMRIEDLIQFETETARSGKVARIDAKVNSLSDKRIIDLLYEASQAGVEINLNVRGICCLRPGVTGLSENIRVVCIVDKFLEHARLFCFHHDGDMRTFIASSDLMSRNLDRRVELLIPIEDVECRQRVLKVLSMYFRDNSNAHELQSDGDYRRLSPGGAPAFRSQEALYEYFRDLHSAKRHHQTTLFQAYKADSQDG